MGLIGHVDHGKTSLTKALSGKWTDTHSDELKRGISIRLGYADTVFRKFPGKQGPEAYTTLEKDPDTGEESTVLRKVSFVDAPGHEILMTTMLSGAALMQGAVLVIAANEKCPQPQTHEHLMAIRLSGIENLVVAQNKVDLVSRERALENYRQIKAFLKNNGYENAPVIPTAAHFGANVDLLIEAIEAHIPTPEYDTQKEPRMFVARSFDINRPGITPEQLSGGVLGGSITQGELHIGDEIEIAPGTKEGKITTKIASLSTEKGPLEKAHPGGLVAIGTLLDPSYARNDQLRGQVVGQKGRLGEPTEKVSLEAHAIERFDARQKSELRTSENVVLTVGTMTALGRVTSARKEKIEIQLQNKVVCEHGQKVAISKQEGTRWRLVAYGIIQ